MRLRVFAGIMAATIWITCAQAADPPGSVQKGPTADPLSNLTDEQFREIMELSLEKSLRDLAQGIIARAPRPVFASNIQWLEENAHRLAPGMLYAFAIRMLPHDPDKAVFWWRVARIRFSLDSALCKDKSVGARYYNYDHQFKGAVRRQGLTQLKVPLETTLAAMDWIDRNPNHKVSLAGHCSSGLEGMGASMKRQGIADKSPWGADSKAKSMPGHIGRVEIVEPPKENDDSRWVKPGTEHGEIISSLKRKIRSQIETAIKNHGQR